ncbi:MAG TPA: hypothetical protein VGJ97_11620 [Anaerolineaceae bacterium]|jgi:hypothetical protein
MQKRNTCTTLSGWLILAGLLIGLFAIISQAGQSSSAAALPGAALNPGSPVSFQAIAVTGSLPPKIYLPLVSAPQAAPAGSPRPSATPKPDPTPAPVLGGDPQPAFPIRAAFYYPWFPNAWNQLGIFPYTNYHPGLGYYDSGDLATIKKHIAAMQYGHIQAGIASWWGQGQHTDTRIPNLLRAAAGSDFRWSLYYENESTGDPSVAQIRSDLTYIHDHYAQDPSFLRINGKFVVFVYASPADGCGMADRWKQANTLNAYVVLKVFPGFAACASQPDSWHQYDPAVASDQQGALSTTISPGFWLMGNPVRLARSLTQWNADVRAMVAATQVKFQLITTFNEWGEGTAVESAQEWASPSGYGQYLDALHNLGK